MPVQERADDGDPGGGQERRVHADGEGTAGSVGEGGWPEPAGRGHAAENALPGRRGRGGRNSVQRRHQMLDICERVPPSPDAAPKWSAGWAGRSSWPCPGGQAELDSQSCSSVLDIALEERECEGRYPGTGGDTGV